MEHQHGRCFFVLEVTNMAAMTSCENALLRLKRTQFSSGCASTVDVVNGIHYPFYSVKFF